jgi:hypothetical protein
MAIHLGFSEGDFFSTNKKKLLMARSQHTFAKRQREIDKKKKAAAKREKREDKKVTGGSGPEIATYVVNHGLVIGNVEEGLSAQKPSEPHVQRLEEVKEAIENKENTDKSD